MEQRDIEYLPVARLIVDPTVQRATDPLRVGRMAADFDEDALGVLTVSHRKNGTYHIIDGAHRTGAAKLAKGEDYEVPCTVWRGLSIEAEARMFRLLNNTRKVDALPLFRVRMTEGEETAVTINMIVEEAGWKISTTTGALNGLNAVAVLERLYRLDPDALGRALATLARAWGTDGPAGDGRLIEGIGLLFHRYGTAVEPDELARKLAPVGGGPGAFLGRARQMRDLVGYSLPNAVAEIAVETYNKGRRTRVLPPWRSA